MFGFVFLLILGMGILILTITLCRSEVTNIHVTQVAPVSETTPSPSSETIPSRATFERETPIPIVNDTFLERPLPVDTSLPERLVALAHDLGIRTIRIDEQSVFSSEDTSEKRISSVSSVSSALNLRSAEDCLYTVDWEDLQFRVVAYHPSVESVSIPLFDRFHRAGKNVVYVPVLIDGDPSSEYITHFYDITTDVRSRTRKALINLHHNTLNHLESVLMFLRKSRKHHAIRELDVLHITCHTGCEKHINYVSKRLQWSSETFNAIRMTDLDSDSVFNMLPDRADAFWQTHKHRIIGRDLVIVSDTAPLSRVILRHMDEYAGNLIVWICNRFDYAHNTEGLKNPFPDEDWYRCLCEASKTYWDRVRIVSYTKFERIYALDKQVFWFGAFADAVIRPIGTLETVIQTHLGAIPDNVRARKSEYLFIPPYINDELLIDFEFLNTRNIRWYRGRYAGSKDLVGFRAILHVPYAYSNLALFENLTNGLVYYLPSLEFMNVLIQKSQWFQDGLSRIHLAEWYDPGNANLFVYFDSWEDLAFKLSGNEHEKRVDAISRWVQHEQRETVLQWESVSDFFIATK